MSFNVVNIFDQIKSIGEKELREDLACFSCDVNPEIEKFIRNKAIDFARRKLSVTYLVTDADDGEILGFFALTHKAVLIPRANLSKSSLKKLERFAQLDRATGEYMASAFLIAQF